MLKFKIEKVCETVDKKSAVFLYVVKFSDLFVRVRAGIVINTSIKREERKGLTKLDNNEKFKKLKPKQRKLAEVLCNPENNMTITELCKEFNISRQTFYNWQSDSDFKDYVEWLLSNFTDSALPRAWKEVVKKIEAGSMEAIKMLFEIKGIHKNEISLNGNGVTIINNIGDTDD